MANIDKWWGGFSFSLAETKSWRIGERVITIKRSAKEWTIWNKQTDTEINKPIVVGKLKAKETFDDTECSRYILGATSESLVIEPSLADRAMIVRPATPLVLSSNEQIEIFVSTPLWMTILIPPREVPLADIPFWRPSDSWFGSTTMTGDLCYSKYTDAKLDESLLELRDCRATTKVTLKNELDVALVIERLNLPVPSLQLYVDTKNRFWTDQVSILQSYEHNKSVSYIKHSTPTDMSDLTLVSESRVMSKKSSFLSSIKNLVA